MDFFDCAYRPCRCQAVSVLNLLHAYGIRERFCGPWEFAENTLWLHGASLGECKVLVDLAKRLRSEFCGARILITTQKAEIVETLKASLKDDEDYAAWVQVALAPAPFAKTTRKFLSQVKPVALVLCENELWPAYLKECKNAGVKIALVSGRFKSAAPWAMLNAIDFATFQTEGDRERFLQRCNLQNKMQGATISGNWKLLKPLPLPVQGQGGDGANRNGNFFDIAFVSLHFSEWPHVANLVQNACKENKRVLIAPRRLEEIPRFEKAAPITVSIVRQFGMLQSILPQCKFAVMGGSFVKRPGIHNFLEPLSLGVPTFVGPFANGEEELTKMFLDKKILVRMNSGAVTLPSHFATGKEITKLLKEEQHKVEGGYRQLLQTLKIWMNK